MNSFFEEYDLKETNASVKASNIIIQTIMKKLILRQIITLL